MKAMFGACKKLKFLDLSNFNTLNVTNMQWMFNTCNELKEIKGLTNFNTAKVHSMKGMFEECDTLEKLDLSSFDTHNVIDYKVFFLIVMN